MIMDAAKSGNLKNALFTSANTVSMGAMDQFNYVYQSSKDGVINTLKDLSSNPVVQQVGGGIASFGNNLLNAPIVIAPYYLLDPSNWIGDQNIPT